VCVQIGAINGNSTEVDRVIAQFPDRHVKASASTRVQVAYALDRFARFCRTRGVNDLVDATTEVLDSFGVFLVTTCRTRGSGRPRRLAPATVSTTLRQVQRLFATLACDGQLLLNPAVHFQGSPARQPRLDRAVRPRELAAMVAATKGNTPLALRNRGLLEILFGCGLRRAEVAALDLYDVDLGDGAIHVHRGKGGRTRRVPIAGQAAQALTTYVQRGRPELVGADSGLALFLSQRRRRLGPARIAQIVSEASQRAKLGRHVSPHQLRHGFATALVRGGADIRAVQMMLGHALVETTEWYTHLDVSDLRRMHRATHPRERAGSRP